MSKPWTKEMQDIHYALIDLHEKIEKEEELTDKEMGLLDIAFDYITDNTPQFVLWQKKTYLQNKMSI